MATTLLMALALMLVIEGLLPFLAPKLWRETFLRLMQLSVRPKKRICPSESCTRRRKVSRQSLGARNGSNPSITSIRASAMRSVVTIGHHFRLPPAFPAESLR